MPVPSPARVDDLLVITTPEGVELELRLAGPASRFIAGVTDLIIQVVLILALGLVTGGTGSARLNAVAFLIGSFLIWFGYPIAFEVLAAGRTPGKRMTHLRVLRTSGAPVDLPASAIRNLVRVIDGPLLLYIPSIVCVLATARNQRPGDLAAATLVVREPYTRRRDRKKAAAVSGGFTGGWGPRTAAADLAGILDGGAGEAAEPLAGWDLTAIGTAELAAVRAFLARRLELETRARAELATRLANGLLAKIPGAQPEGNPEQFLERLLEAKSGRRDRG